ncbi:MAG: RusA family crossover junction endodeoxyribonuclease [Actinomycetes bacterium]
MPVTFTVYGDPRPQGSKRHVGRGILVESGGQAFHDWRYDMTCAAREAMSARQPLTGPVEVRATFSLKRPASAKKAGAYHAKRPDLDKLLRALLDALQASGVVEDDGQVARLLVTKTYPGELVSSPRLPGVRVDILVLSPDA